MHSSSIAICSCVDWLAWSVLTLLVVCSLSQQARADASSDAAQAGKIAAQGEERGGEDSTESVSEILASIQVLIQQEPVDQGPAEQSEKQQLTQARTTAQRVVAAAGQALALHPSAEQAAEAHFHRLQALDVLRQLGDEGAEVELDLAIAAARAEKITQVVAVGTKFYIEAGMSRWPTFSDEQKANWASEIGDYIRQVGVDKSQVETLMVVADFLGNEQEYELGKNLLAPLLQLVREHAAPEVQGAAPMLEGIARRLDLPGQELTLAGTLLGGGTFEWERYRGKVVLVDFFASWCGPCQEELPNVLQMYRRYHDRGFDVVAICIDEDPEIATAFVEKKHLPWATLYSADPKRRGWDDPLAVHLGVTGIPFAILLDAEGKVVSMNARGPELDRLLHDLLGDPTAQLEQSIDSADDAPQIANEP